MSIDFIRKQEAGSRIVHELHGTIRAIQCCECAREADLSDFQSGAPCVSCGGLLRPGVVLFGEELPQDAWRAAVQAMGCVQLVFVIGTSFQVFPTN